MELQERMEELRAEGLGVAAISYDSEEVLAAFAERRDGRVTSRFFEEFYRERNTAANIMLKLGTPISGIAGSSGETAQLAEIDALTLTGRLDYQACDDKVCFNPASVPLTWTLTVSPLDRQRALAARQ